MSLAIDNKKIVDFLLKNFEKKQIFKLDDKKEINSLITDLEDAVYPEWLEIKDSILNKKRINLSYTEAEINKLEKLYRIYCDEILNKFCELNSSIQETIDKNIEYQSALQKLNIDYGILSTEKKEQPNNFDENKRAKLTAATQMIEILNKKIRELLSELENKVEIVVTRWKHSTSEEEYQKYLEIELAFGFNTRNLGKYPVIFITFNNADISKEQNIDENIVISQIKSCISRGFREHKYLYRDLLEKCIKSFSYFAQDKRLVETEGKRTSQLNNNLEFLIKNHNPKFKGEDIYADLERFRRLYVNNGKDATTINVQLSIKFLSRLLLEFHGKKPYVLIDEYDKLLNSSSGKSFYQIVVNTIKGIFLPLKNNANIEKTVVTGVLPVATKADLFSGINFFIEYGVLDKPYSKQFGFTEAEIDELLKATLAPNTFDTDKNSIKRWYKGYYIGNEILYNPWSIINCLQFGELKEFWINTGNAHMLQTAFENFSNRAEINTLISTGKLSQKIVSSVDLTEINTNSQAFYPLMLHSGYLTKSENNVFKIPTLK